MDGKAPLADVDECLIEKSLYLSCLFSPGQYPLKYALLQFSSFFFKGGILVNLCYRKVYLEIG